MFNLTQYFKNKGYENKIDFYNLKNSNFIATQVVDVTVFWLNILSNDNEVVYVDEIVVVFYSKNNDYYTIYFTNETHFLNSFLNSKLENLLNNGNKLHYVLSDSSNRNFLLEFFENKFEHQNLKYSIANINSEVFYEDEPYDLKNLKKVSYIFTGGSIVNRNGESWVKENKSKIV